MRAFWAAAAISLSLIGSVIPTSAQYFDDPGYGYRGRGYGPSEYGYRDREYDYGDRRYDYGDRGYGYGNREYRVSGYGFDEQEYLRCNPDVLRAVQRGQMESAIAHYRVFGRREHRRLSC